MLKVVDDLHFPTLTVNRTMKFALRNKVPTERPEHLLQKQIYVKDKRDGILDSLGIAHTQKTRVGNEFIRGVSGGERKRVSLAEMMAGQVGLCKLSTCFAVIANETRAPCNSGITQPAALIRRQRPNLGACCDTKPTPMARLYSRQCTKPETQSTTNSTKYSYWPKAG